MGAWAPLLTRFSEVAHVRALAWLPVLVNSTFPTVVGCGEKGGHCAFVCAVTPAKAHAAEGSECRAGVSAARCLFLSPGAPLSRNTPTFLTTEPEKPSQSPADTWTVQP